MVDGDGVKAEGESVEVRQEVALHRRLRTAYCIFEGSAKTYAYLTDEDVKANDLALVLVDSRPSVGERTSSFLIDGRVTTGTLKIVAVTDVRDTIDSKATKFLLSVISLDGYSEKLKRLSEVRRIHAQLEELLEKGEGA